LRDSSQLAQQLRELFSSQSLAVLATHSEGQSYGSLVAFAVTEDLKHLLFATTRATRKYANLMKNPRVAMVMDNRSNEESDFHQAMAVTATGQVREATGSEKDRFTKVYLSKHPHLVDFVSSPTCALVTLEVETYYLVSQFQNVTEFHMKLPASKGGASRKGSFL
jgi:nitroimidazol reductase NimA-like FMN-containing flavoprotein (pyridoxamine 5'-phosphate oxidase superfamily)